MERFSDLTKWRRELHTHPELGFEEKRTSAFVANQLRELGLETHVGLAKTGVVGVLRSGTSNRGVGLRAELDALPVCEANNFGHRSTTPGAMHACGHDGHITMLLGAAQILAKSRDFDGVVHFIFQPAEENLGGARAMIADGLFERFSMSSVYALHNWPDLPAGEFGIRAGSVMASMDRFEIELQGKGAHAAMPHRARDPIVASGQLVLALQTISSRLVNPTSAVVVSVTQVHAGEAWNVIPQSAMLRGTIRALDESTRELAKRALVEISSGVATAHGVEARVVLHHDYPVTINSPAEAELANKVAAGLGGEACVHRDLPASLASEDFAFMLQAKAGCYCWIGNGRPETPLHSPNYDFNDDVIPSGASFLAAVAQAALR